MNAYARAILALILVTTCLTGAALADHNETGAVASDHDDDPIIDLDPLIEAVQQLLDMFDDWEGRVTNLLESVLFDPFLRITQELLTVVAKVLTTTPSVQDTTAVQEVHQQTLLITYLLSSLVFLAAGILHMTGPIVGVSFADVRLMLPRVVVALVFATFSLPLLELAVDLTNALNQAFAPDGLQLSIEELLGVGSGLVLVWVTKSIGLLVLVSIFILRAVYILFVAAISPLLALMWSVPKLRRYAETFISGWFAALMFAPLDLLVLRFALALMRGSAGIGFETIATWILGIASLVLLILVPFQVWTASQAVVGQSYRASKAVRQRVSSVRRKDKKRPQQGSKKQRRKRRRHPRERRENWK